MFSEASKVVDKPSKVKIDVRLCTNTYIHTLYICMCVCMYVCMSVYMSVCMYACMYVCMYVCTYVCHDHLLLCVIYLMLTLQLFYHNEGS